MKKRTRANGPFSESDLARLHEAALEILDRTGLRVEHEGARKILAQHPGARVNGETVRLSQELVHGQVPVPFGPGRAPHSGPLRLGVGGYCLRVRDLETGQARPPTLSDMIMAVKLADSYEAEGAVPLTPTDLPAAVQPLAMYRYGWEHSRAVFGEVLTRLDTAEAAWEMSQVMGAPFRFFIYARSPLRIDMQNLELALRFAGRGAQLQCCTMGIMGLTAPLPLPGAFAQSLAEMLGLIAIVRLCAPRARILGAEFFLSSTDMKSGHFSFARPENTLVNAASLQLMDYFGFEMRREAWLHTSAKEPCFQSATEKAARLAFLTRFGVEMASNLGMLGNDECFSSEQFVMDAELVRYVERIAGVSCFTPESLCMDAIAECVEGCNFLTHDSTLDNWSAQFRPALFDYQSWESWIASGAKSLVESARAIARARVAGHSYRLDEARLRAIDAIYKKACARLGTE